LTSPLSNSPFGTGVTPETDVGLSRVSPPIDRSEVSILDHLPAYQIDKLSDDQKAGLSKSIDRDGFLHFAPMICRDYACPMIEKCPLKRLQIIRPIGDDCPVESAEIRAWEKRLFETLPKEEQGDPFNIMLIRDIVLLQLNEQRAMVKVAETGDIEQDITVGHAPDGSPLMSKDVHRGIQVYEKLRKMKDKLMSKLLATPQDKVKAATSGMYDRSRAAAELMVKMEELEKKRQMERRVEENTVDAEFEVKE